MTSPNELRPSGGYVEHDGTTYAVPSVHKPFVRLMLPEGMSPPDGFTRDDRGEWSTRLRRTDVARIYRLTTRARWRGHEVEVREVRDGRVRIEGSTYPPPPEPEVTTPENTYWQAWVAPSELDDVTETVTEIAP